MLALSLSVRCEHVVCMAHADTRVLEFCHPNWLSFMYPVDSICLGCSAIIGCHSLALDRLTQQRHLFNLQQHYPLHPIQVGVTFEEVDEIVLLEDGLPFIAGRYAEPVQPNLLRMRALLSASKHNIALVDGMDNVRPLVCMQSLQCTLSSESSHWSAAGHCSSCSECP